MKYIKKVLGNFANKLDTDSKKEVTVIEKIRGIGFKRTGIKTPTESDLTQMFNSVDPIIADEIANQSLGNQTFSVTLKNNSKLTFVQVQEELLTYFAIHNVSQNQNIIHFDFTGNSHDLLGFLSRYTRRSSKLEVVVVRYADSLPAHKKFSNVINLFAPSL